MPDEVHYSDYLQLDKILNAQDPESDRRGMPAHDEMLFIVIHQAYELWFKQLLHETESVIRIMQTPAMDDNSPELQTIVHRLSRCSTILKVMVHQIDIMETMTPMDFLDFRDMLRPASGFQSWQFKLLEARLGLKYEHRYGKQYYVSQLREPEIAKIKEGEKEMSLLEFVNTWLERMPFFGEADNWKNFKTSVPQAPPEPANPSRSTLSSAPSSSQPGSLHPFWLEYRHRYQQSLADPEKANLELFDVIFYSPVPGQTSAVPPSSPAAQPSVGAQPPETLPGWHVPPPSLSPAACRSALFIMLYRGYPMLQLPFQVLNQLLEIDEQLSTWRYRHMSMVHRMIGTRIGTGGSTGKDYLRSAMESHHLFKEIARLTSFLIERRKLPPLSPEMERRLGFNV
ncbi:MAG TPA: tryptophan 2,3-dioxygenase family protein [Puia sp.]|nr:tryptophan 2,3-dioxygenase family protein [Puia sp.]